MVEQGSPGRLKRKVYAYITHRNDLLVFRHPESPEAGIQVPGGTVEESEDLAVAVLREAREETGLEDLTIVAFLGEAFRAVDDFPDNFSPGEVHHRFFYHLECEGEPPSAWRHHERFATNGDGRPIAFDFFWAALPDDTPELIADQGQCMPALLTSLAGQAK
jgi:8-oxo-dGTP pyrophosphatase MutT (NUDIX family)